MLLVSGATKTVREIGAHPCLGQLMRPGNGNRPTGLAWAADNGAFAGLDVPAFEAMLAWIRAAESRPLWVTVPDVVAEHDATLALFREWAPRMSDLPLAFVAQNGCSADAVPWDEIACLFIGGDTAWKLSAVAREIGAEAKRRGKWLHMGRVNSVRRMRIAQSFGCDSIDGTSYSMFANTFLRRALGALAGLDAQTTLWGAS